MAAAAIPMVLGLIGGGVSTWGAYRAEKDKKSAADHDMRMAEMINEINYRKWREGRGEGGYAQFPLYAPQGSEKDAFMHSLNLYKAARGGAPEEELAKYENIVSPLKRSLDEGQTEIDKILSGKSEQERLSSYEPVAKARTAVGEAAKESAELSMQTALSKARADEARKGYTGTGSFARNLMLKTAIPYAQTGAVATAGAKLQNEEERYRIPTEEQRLRLGTIPMVGAMAQDRTMLEALPTTAAINQQMEATRALTPWMLKPDHFTYQRPPGASGASPTGALLTGVGSGISSVASSIGPGGGFQGAAFPNAAAQGVSTG